MSQTCDNKLLYILFNMRGSRGEKRNKFCELLSEIFNFE